MAVRRTRRRQAIRKGRRALSLLLSVPEEPDPGHLVVLSQGVTFGIGTNLKSGTGGELPLYERFFPGGVGGPGDVRGYQLYSLGTAGHDSKHQGRADQRSGRRRQQGTAVQQRNHVPDSFGLGIRGVIFTDAGQSFRLKDSLDLDAAAGGVGIRRALEVAVRPASVDIAFPLNPRPADQSTVFEIGAGSPL